MIKQVLIVDDEVRQLNSLKALFEARGTRVKTASSSREAIDIFRKSPFEAVISDIKMEKMDGIQLMHVLKQMDPCVQIVFLTGYATIENVTAALKQNNAFDYLKKPLACFSDLYQTTEKAVGRYHELKNDLARSRKKEQGAVVFRNIFDSMEAIVYVADLQTYELIYANKKFMEAFNSDTCEQAIGKKCWQVIQKDQAGPCPFCTNKRLILPDGRLGEAYQWEFRNTFNNRWYSIVDKAITWYDKRIVRLETAFDITEKKEHESLFRQFEKSIETSRKIASIGTLAGGVAHDFNNTLSAVIGNINLAQLCCSDDETQNYLKSAENAIMQAKQISSKLITFAQGGGPNRIHIQIEQIVRRALKKYQDDIKIKCSVEADVIPIPFYADPDQLETVFDTIFQNAMESISGKGRISVNIRYLENPLKHPQIAITISDSGSGISREHLDMIFNPYFTTKPLDNRKGTGLGLSIAWSIISRHGGNIHVESEINQGTTVHIFLPIFGKNEIEALSEKVQSPRTDLKLRKSSIRVLVMDDDALALDVIAQLLKLSGYETLVASNGDQALGICNTLMASDKRIDIALLDFEVNGGLNGFQTLEHLRNIDPHIKGILMTGHTDNTEINKYRQKGFSAMLEKPFSIMQLNDKINDLLMPDYPLET